MEEFKIIELFVKYFGETGSLVVMILVIAYGVFKYYTIRKQDQVITEIRQYLRILSQKYSDTITYEQAEIVLKDVYSSTSYILIHELFEVIERNNIEKDWKSIIAKIKDMIDIEYAEDYARLTKFVHNDMSLGQFMQNKNRDYLYEGITNTLEKYSGDEAKKQICSFVRNSFMKFYNEDIQKIDKRKKDAED